MEVSPGSAAVVRRLKRCENPVKEDLISSCGGGGYSPLGRQDTRPPRLAKKMMNQA
jgi:hypothetical protein